MRIATERRGGFLPTAYAYNLRSWVTHISTPLFCQRLFYAEPSEGGIPLYGGAISGMDWQTIGDSVRSYRYQYDGLGRLTSADYLESGHSSDRYVTEYSYDLMGNILTLSRSGKVYDEIYGITDDLTYQYDGNRLIRVTNHAADTPAYKDAMYYADGADLDTERTYDANGNMTSNADSRISRISYDALNMPCRIDYIDGSHIDYTYVADGVKQRVDYYLNPYTSSLPDDDCGTACDSSLLVHTWREYAGNCVYVCDTLSMILINGGYITFDYTTHQPIYHYYLKDYLGNNRITVSLADGRIEEVNHYYPFGGLMGDSRNATTQPYKYIGKELDRTHGLDWYDHGARHYDPVTGRWNVMDALAEKYYPWSPYVSCLDNPTNTLDDNGQSPVAAILEGVGAFVVSAGLDFLDNWLLQDCDAKTAISKVCWGTAVASGLSTAALSFFVDGTGSAKTYKTIANSKVGRIAIDIAQSMATNILHDIEEGKDIEFKYNFIGSAVSALVSYGFSEKATELLTYLKSSNKSYKHAANKLSKNRQAGKNKNRLSHDKAKVKNQKQKVLKATNDYVTTMNCSRLVGGVASNTAVKVLKKLDDEIKDKD